MDGHIGNIDGPTTDQQTDSPTDMKVHIKKVKSVLLVVLKGVGVGGLLQQGVQVTVDQVYKKQRQSYQTRFESIISNIPLKSRFFKAA